ncbi:MAG: hypothetical protein RLZZ609_911 [Cyanobacteriota bacterium]
MGRTILTRQKEFPLPSGEWLALKPLVFSSFLSMTQTKTGASHFKGRLFTTAFTSALALSAVTGGMMVTGGAAKAGACPGNTVVTYQDLGLTFTDTVSNAQSNVALTKCDLELTGLKYPFAQKQVDIDYNPTPLVGQNDVVTFQINKTPGYFDQWSLQFSDGTNLGEQVIADIYATQADLIAGTNPLTNSLISTGPKVILPIPNHYNHLFVKASMFTNGGTIDNVIIHFRDVPGPLPILGAGLAIGSVRKLRNLTSRLKVHSMA